MDKAPPLIRLPDAAKRLCVSMSTMQQLIRHGFPVIHIGHAVRIDPRDIDAWVARMKTSGTATRPAYAQGESWWLTPLAQKQDRHHAREAKADAARTARERSTKAAQATTRRKLAREARQETPESRREAAALRRLDRILPPDWPLLGRTPQPEVSTD